jgi:branched-chain amino acid aminotransferase
MGAAEEIVFLNGAFVAAADAKISIFDSGFLYGDGVFDTSSAWNGYIFKLDEHIERLLRSCHAVRLEVPMSAAEFRQAHIETVARNGLQNAYIKCIVTRGIKDPPTLDPRGREAGVIIFAKPYIRLVRDDDESGGIRAKISSVRRTPMAALDPKIKSLDYLNLVMAKFDAIDADVDDAILCDMEGFVCEGPGYNIFIVSNGELITPVDTVLMGITRETMIEIGSELGLTVAERRFSPFDLYTADEAFFSTTAGGVVPIVNVDGRDIGSGRRGEVTKCMSDRYWDMLENGEHGTPVLSNRSLEQGDG